MHVGPTYLLAMHVGPSHLLAMHVGPSHLLAMRLSHWRHLAVFLRRAASKLAQAGATLGPKPKPGAPPLPAVQPRFSPSP